MRVRAALRLAEFFNQAVRPCGKVTNLVIDEIDKRDQLPLIELVWRVEQDIAAAGDFIVYPILMAAV